MEIFAAEAQIRSLLQNSGLFPGIPIEPAPYPEDMPYPAITYKLLTPEPDTLAIGSGQPYMSTLDYLVVAENADQTLGSIVSMVQNIDLALTGKGGTNQYGTVFMISRIRPHNMPYRSVNGKTYQVNGYLFQVRVQGNYGA